MSTILIVDDEAEIRTLLAKTLTGAGHACNTAANTSEAKMLLTEQPYDLVMTDIDMPGENGIELIKHVNHRYPQTASLVVTVFDDPKLAKEVFELGVNGYIIKPFTKNLVLITVENALRLQRLEMQEKLHTALLEREVAARTRGLDEQVNFLQKLLDAIPLPIYFKNTATSYLGCNAAFEELINRSRETITGKRAADIHPAELAAFVQQKDEELLHKGGTQRYERVIRHADGTLHTGIIHKATFTGSSGAIGGLVGIGIDITDLKETEQSLRLSEEKLRSIMDNLQIGVVMVDTQMRLMQINRQMHQWFPEVKIKTGAYCYQTFCGSDRNTPCDGCPVSQVLTTGVAAETFNSMETATGKRFFRTITSPIRDEQNAITAVVELLEDITEKQEAERELRQAQKLEAIGQLAAGIAHEINTPVQYVGDNIRFFGSVTDDMLQFWEQINHLLTAAKAGKPLAGDIAALEEWLEQVDLAFTLADMPSAIRQSLDGIEHIGAIVRAMREFSHPGSEEKTVMDINRALNNTLVVSRNEWKYVAEAVTDLDPDLPLLSCLPAEINQVFLNIIVNAAHAIGDLSTDGHLEPKGQIRVSTRTKDGWIEIRIADTGSGIPEAIQHRVFDPFFTTKKIGKGTGQGLAIARTAIVDKHQGTLHFITQPGQGTTFVIRLPIAASSPGSEPGS